MINASESQAGLTNYLTADGVAEWLGVSKRWVQRYTREGEIPSIKIGRRFFYVPEQVEAWIASRGELAA